ncbi:MAG: class I adenylate-forming enzyme family protein [Gammaproteobacteria bacterium]
MTAGRSRRKLGVSESLVQAFGPMIFDLSHNLQLRRGDPVRNKDYAELEKQRADLGISDLEIADRIGLTHAQVTLIRNLMERRRFHRSNYYRLNALGGGRRYRSERVDERQLNDYSDDVTGVRAAMHYPPELVTKYVANGWWRNECLSGWLQLQARQQPDELALISDSETISWDALHARVNARAAGLHAIGVQRGDVVALQLPNTVTFLECYLAIARLGAIMTTLYLPHRKAEMPNILGFANAKIAILPSDTGDFSSARCGQSLKAELPHLEHIICVGDEVSGCVSIDELNGPAVSIEKIDFPVGSDPFLLLFTSGTTAAPKAVPLSYHNMLSNARLGVPEHQINSTDRILSAAPYGHLFPLYSFHLALASGAATVLLPTFSPPTLSSAIGEHQPTCLFAAPAHIAACEKSKLIQPSWPLRLIVLSGSAVSAKLAQNLHKRLPSAMISQLWGMTETQAGLYTRPDDPIELAAKSAGRPSPGTEVRIVDETNVRVSNGEQGELQVRGCLLFPAYVNNEDANRQAFTDDHWFRTGDLATQDDGGNVTITGRLKDVINRGGVKYNPRDVEELLDTHPAVEQSAIISLPDPVLGERACCFIIATNEPAPGLDALCEYLLNHGISKVKLPERLVVVDSLPLTPTRKVIKGKLVVPD